MFRDMFGPGPCTGESPVVDGRLVADVEGDRQRRDEGLRGRSGAGSACRWFLTVIAGPIRTSAALAAALCALMVVACGGGKSSLSPATPIPVLAAAGQYARDEGDPHPSLPVQWTTSTMQRAASYLQFGQSPGAGDGPVWVVQIRGTFQCNTCKAGGGQPGTVIILVIAMFGVPLCQASDFSFGSTVQDLSRLGAVRTFKI